MSRIWAFAMFAAVLTVTPGLDTMLVLRTTALSGRRAGIASAVGIGAGCLAWAVASAVGVTAVLAASQLAFETLRAAGVAYLCWLGARALWQARLRPSLAAMPVGTPAVPPGADVESTVDRPRGPRSLRTFRTGFATNMLNPKVGVFYLSVMPQFLPSGASPLAASLLLAGIHIIEGLIWMSLVVLAVNRARGWLTRPAVKRGLERLTGVAFLGFGLRLALTSDLR